MHEHCLALGGIQPGYVWGAHVGLCAPLPKERPPYTITDPLPNQSCQRMVQAGERSPQRLQTLTSGTCAQCEPAFICKEPKFANLGVL